MLRRVSFSGALARVLSLPRILVDLLLAPVTLALALFCSLLVPVQAQAQTVGGAAVDYAYQRTMANIVSGSAAGLQVSRGATMNILNAGKVVGSFALNEKRLIDIATMAKIARASTLPGIIAIGATELLNYGLQKCADGTWCTAAQTAPSGSTVVWSTTGWHSPWGSGGTYTAQAAAEFNVPVNCGPLGTWSVSRIVLKSGGLNADVYCKRASDGYETYASVIGRDSPYVAPSSDPVPATDADVETGWKGAFQAKPYLMVNSFGFEDQTTQNQQWADALAQTAQLIAPTTATVAEPATSTTTAGQTTKVQRTCTYTGTANADASTQKDQPVSVGVTCLTTTTNPDGTTTTKTETTDAAPKGAAAVPPKVDIDTCGLPGKPACKIDETGTKAQTDVDAELTQRSADIDSRSSVLQGAANDAMSSVEQRHSAVHIFGLFNLFPTFASESCDNPTVPGVSGGSLPVDICTYYYMLKDVMSFGVALFVLVDSVQVVREAVKV